LRGEKYDAHDFIPEALRNGAAAVVIDRRHANTYSQMGVPAIVVPDTLQALQKMATLHRRKFDIPIVAITGTNGKTTTKEMLAWILQSKFNVHKTWGNLNNHIGVPLTLLHLTAGHQISVLEMGTNHPGEIALLAALAEPTAALITISAGAIYNFSETSKEWLEKNWTCLNAPEPMASLSLIKTIHISVHIHPPATLFVPIL